MCCWDDGHDVNRNMSAGRVVAGRAMLGSGVQGLQVLGIGTGTLLRHVALRQVPKGGWPAMLVPDERSGRVFAIVHPLFGPGADQVAVFDAVSGQQVGPLRWLPFLPGAPATQTATNSVTVIDLSRVSTYGRLGVAVGAGVRCGRRLSVTLGGGPERRGRRRRRRRR
jgi:hypothetical protein